MTDASAMTWGEMRRAALNPTFGVMRKAGQDHNWASVKSENGLLAYYVSEHLGSPVVDRYESHVHCPIPDHLDENPSFRIDGEQWVCTCNNNSWGDLGDLIERVDGVSNADALAKAVELRDEFQDSGWEPPPTNEGSRPKADPVLLGAEILEGQEAARASEFHDRDILVELLEAKGIDHQVDRALLIETWRLALLVYGPLVAPHYDRQGEITGYKERTGVTDNWIARPDSAFPALYGAWLDSGAEKVILTEGETDTWLMWSRFKDEGWDVFGLPSGAHGPNSDMVEMLTGRRVVLAFDADEAGAEAAQTWASKLAGKAAAVSIAQFDEGTDACSTSNPRKAIDDAQPVTASSSRIISSDDLTCYLRTTKDDAVPVSNFVFIPTRRLRFIDDPGQYGYQGYLADDPQRTTITLLASDLVSDPRLSRWASRLSGGRMWKGNKRDVAELAELLRSKAPFLPVLNTVRTSGLHDGVFVLDGQVFGPPGAEMHWWYEPLTNFTGTPKRGQSDPSPTLQAPSHWDIATAMKSMLALTDPTVITPILAWLAVALLRELFDQFPVLAIQGQSGAGKTAMIELLLDVWFGQPEVQNIGSSTSFVDSVELTRSNAIPLALDEYRGGHGPRQRYRLSDTDELVRLSYRKSGTLKRGEVNDSGTGVRTVRMNRPLIVLGETIFEDKAVRERSVMVQPHEASRNPHAFRELSQWAKRHPGGFGAAYLQWLVDNKSDMLRGGHPGLRNSPTDRPSINAAILELGWELLSEFAQATGIQTIHVALDLTRVVEEWTREIHGNPIWFEGIRRAIDEAATYGEAHKPIVFNHAGPEGTLCVQVDALVKWLKREGADLPGNTMTAKAALTELFPSGERDVRRWYASGFGQQVKIKVFDIGLTDLDDTPPPQQPSTHNHSDHTLTRTPPPETEPFPGDVSYQAND